VARAPFQKTWSRV